MNNKVKLITVAVLSLLVMSAAILSLLVWNGEILINNPSRKYYPVRGVDVSAYQGSIDWSLLASQDIDFAFIKATEGSGFTDRNFVFNYSEALKTDLRVGAYHFFSFESGGDTQAAHFINTVPKTENMLPPVIDLEFYGGFSEENVERDKIVNELDKMIAALYSHYGMHPIIYTAEEEYALFLEDGYENNPIWIRGVYSKPDIEKLWTFWQYTNRARLDGYNGTERFIDMNVFNGSFEEFKSFGK